MNYTHYRIRFRHKRDVSKLITDTYFKALGEVAILELLDLLRLSMEMKRMNSHTEEFSLSNIAMLMDVAMQFGIDIREFNAENR